MMAIEATMAGKLEGTPLGVELLLLLRGGEFSQSPGFEVGLHVFRLTPVSRQIGKLGLEFESQSRMTGGNPVVVHVVLDAEHLRGAAVALGTGGSANRKSLQLQRLLGLCTPLKVPVLPIHCRTGARFAGD